MGSKPSRRKPELVLRDGEPSAVILDIETYREMVELLEDAKDLKELERMRSKPLKFKKLEEFLQEQGLSVWSLSGEQG